MMNNEMDIILSRYFSGEATTKERHTLDIWLAKSDENEHYFHQMTLLYQYIGQENVLPAIDTEKALSKFKNYMYGKQENSSSPFLKISTIWKAAAAVAILAIGTFSLLYFINQPAKTIQLMAVETCNEFNISENTHVRLFSGSEISYNSKRNHEIQLKGKATFTISSKENSSAKNSKGIVVQAGETYIKDIGTVFTVDATEPDKLITVDVSQGEVKFYTNSNTGIYLKSNEKAIYNVQTKQFKTIVETLRTASPPQTTSPQPDTETLHATPLQQELIFQNTPLQDAINTIKIRYGVTILIKSKALNMVSLNASFDKNESVENMLDIITETISARWSKEGEVYVIMP